MDDPAQDSKVSAILSELRDVNKDRRRTAVMKLGMVGGEQALRALIGLVENNQEDLIVRGRAALMLGKLKDDRRAAPDSGFGRTRLPHPLQRGAGIGQNRRSPRHRRPAQLCRQQQ